MAPRGGHAGHVARKLNEIVKLPLLQRESKERIAEIWTGHHKDRADAIGRHLKAEHAQFLIDRAAPAPIFVFPVRRSARPSLDIACRFTDMRATS